MAEFCFTKETEEVIRTEIQGIQNQINNLNPIIINKTIKINYELSLTMIDGKICNSVTQNRSTQTCYICKAILTEMNNLDGVLGKISIAEHYKYGLSVLHAWIIFLECCLHISYRLHVKMYQVRGEAKILVQNRKQEIISRLRDQLEIIVDQPKPGYGSTNDRNTARTFRNPQLTSLITGVNENLIQRFSIILQTLSCGYKLNPQRFDEYAKDTAKLYVDNYSWFYMPASVHKVLIHGSEMIKHALLPIG